MHSSSDTLGLWIEKGFGQVVEDAGYESFFLAEEGVMRHGNRGAAGDIDVWDTQPATAVQPATSMWWDTQTMPRASGGSCFCALCRAPRASGGSCSCVRTRTGCHSASIRRQALTSWAASANSQLKQRRAPMCASLASTVSGSPVPAIRPHAAAELLPVLVC